MEGGELLMHCKENPGSRFLLISLLVPCDIIFFAKFIVGCVGSLEHYKRCRINFL